MVMTVSHQGLRGMSRSRQRQLQQQQPHSQHHHHYYHRHYHQLVQQNLKSKELLLQEKCRHILAVQTSWTNYWGGPKYFAHIVGK